MEAVSRLEEGNDGMHHLCQAQHPPSGLLMINADWDSHSAANRSEAQSQLHTDPARYRGLELGFSASQHHFSQPILV